MLPLFGGRQQLHRARNVAAQVSHIGGTLAPHRYLWTENTDLAAKYEQISRITAAAIQNCRGNYTHCLIFEDDAVFHPHFEPELLSTLSSLPKDWRVFHLCPGYLYGRILRDQSNFFKLNPERPPAPASAHSRFYTWNESRGYPGGPVAFIIQPRHATEIASAFRAGILKRPGKSPDAIFSEESWPLSYRARQPQFCHELLTPNGRYRSTLF